MCLETVTIIWGQMLGMCTIRHQAWPDTGDIKMRVSLVSPAQTEREEDSSIAAPETSQSWLNVLNDQSAKHLRLTMKWEVQCLCLTGYQFIEDSCSTIIVMNWRQCLNLTMIELAPSVSPTLYPIFPSPLPLPSPQSPINLKCTQKLSSHWLGTSTAMHFIGPHSQQ